MDIKQAAGAYNAIANIAQTSIADTSKAPSPTDLSFSQLLTGALSDATDSGQKAEKISTLALMGKADITDVATAVSSAELALNTVVAIRDKVISAYQQISQMPM